MDTIHAPQSSVLPTRRYVLKAFPEVHPLNGAIHIMEMYERMFLEARDSERFSELYRLRQQLGNTLKEEPSALRTSTFMDNYTNQLTVIIKRYCGDFSPAIVSIHTKDVAREMEEARQVIDHEFALFDAGNFGLLFHEGMPGSYPPLASYAMKLGRLVIFLDEKGYLERQEQAEREGRVAAFQIEREEGWVSKICPSDHLDKTLLVAGGSHVLNDYGLADRLAAKGIDLEPLPGFGPNRIRRRDFRMLESHNQT